MPPSREASAATGSDQAAAGHLLLDSLTCFTAFHGFISLWVGLTDAAEGLVEQTGSISVFY